jgi:hypothetical protein
MIPDTSPASSAVSIQIQIPLKEALRLPDMDAAPKDWCPSRESTDYYRHVLHGGNPLPPVYKGFLVNSEGLSSPLSQTVIFFLELFCRNPLHVLQ